MSTTPNLYRATPGDNLSLFRLAIQADDSLRLDAVLLDQIRPGERKVHRIHAGSGVVEFDTALSDEELAFIRLVFPTMRYSWLQPWTEEYATR